MKSYCYDSSQHKIRSKTNMDSEETKIMHQNRCLNIYEIVHAVKLRSSRQGCSIKKVFLKISQLSQKRAVLTENVNRVCKNI